MNRKVFLEALKKTLITLVIALVFFSAYFSMVLPTRTLTRQESEEDPGIVLDLPEETEAIDYGYDPFLQEEEREAERTQMLTRDAEITSETEEDSDADGKEEAIEEKKTLYFYDDSTDVIVSVEAPEDAFAEGTVMAVRPVNAEEVIDKVSDALEEGKAIKKVQAVDISFWFNDEEVEPLKPIRVSLTSKVIEEAANAQVVHIGNDGDTKIVEMSEEETNADEVIFEAEDFSTYVVVVTKDYITADGDAYKIVLTYDEEARLPEDVKLEVSEILEGEEYDRYRSEAEKALGFEEGSARLVRVFDIAILADQERIEPESAVDLSIELLDRIDGDFSVIHFEGEEEEPKKIDAESDGNAISFSTDSFSAYAIVQGPEDIPLEWHRLKTMNDLRGHAQEGLYIGTTGGYYLTNVTAASTASSSTNGIVKTKPAYAYPQPDAKAKYYFEEVEDGNDEFYIYCLDDDGNRRYVSNDGGTDLALTGEEDRTAFHIQVDNSSRFRFNNGDRYWNMWGGAGGNVIAAYNVAGDGNNYFYLWNHDDSQVSDPYGLDGSTYGLMNWTGGVAGKAMMAEVSGNRLKALSMPVMAKKNNNNDKLFVPDDGDITLWTFEWVSDDLYYVKTQIDGSIRYLSIRSDGGLDLLNVADDSCKLQVNPGSGTHRGEIYLRGSGKTLTFSGTVENGFNTGGSAGREWLKLVEVSELTSDYFMTYSAEKVSVSDTSKVTNGSHVIVYTRVWNDTEKKYQFYAIDHDGSLVRCFESGDSIEWVGSRLNTMLWDFTEYYWEGTTNPNYYYELYNEYSEKYIAPQVSDRQILSDHTIGINMNGRREGRYYSSIVAWDEDNYAYVSLKADMDSGKIVSCPLSEAEDFYFAIVEELLVNDEVVLVPTVDHTQYGITMKIADFPTRKYMSDFLGSDAGGAVNTTDPNLLSSDLKDNGFPETKAGNDLSELFADAQEVNHLFIESTYYGTGYFEYDSAQNFAKLNSDGEFDVYKEIATVDGGSGAHYQHGQFFPYNDIESGVFSQSNPKNLTTPNGEGLPNTDPRKYESLYLVKNPDYYLGVEVEATFTQTPDGLDDWGHDIIYEFTGDDDFWLYVDGERIIDLGGIHNALSGSVNYRTGEVVVNGVTTTLKDLFYANYIERGHSAEEANAYIEEKFKQNEEGNYIFKDYTSHTMKIFYLERGAGASNLHMRFNLASIKPGTVQLSKQLEGVDATESVLAEFPYQIWYTMDGSDDEHPLKNMIPGTADNKDYVFYKGTSTPVEFKRSLTVAGITYDNVFMLKPEEIADISFPEGMKNYRIVECGINTNVYETIKVNGSVIAGSAGDGYEENRKDFGIGLATTEERARVNYVNAVDPDALRTLTLTKKLFREDGFTPISSLEDSTTFSFRLYLGTEFEEDLPIANMHTYHVKDPEGNYCRWDTRSQKFVSLGITDYIQLTEEQKTAASFTTSVNGAISKIPVDHTVEVRNVLAGTTFRMVERSWEMPDGYSFQKYQYNRTTLTDQDAGVTDTVGTQADPAVTVCNLRGFGLRVNKVWSDADYVIDRETIYFALYTKDASGNLTLVSGSGRMMEYGTESLYWYYLLLPVQTPFDNYEIREVSVNGTPDIGDDEVLPDSVIAGPIANGTVVNLTGIQKGETTEGGFDYTVTYEKGTASLEGNVRTDTVYNERAGFVLKKSDWSGNPLAGATFTLTLGDVNIGTFTSDENGIVTTAFLSEGKDYTLTETIAPQGYRGLENAMTLRLNEGDLLSVTGVDQIYYEMETDDNSAVKSLTVKNRQRELKAEKLGVQANGTTVPLRNAIFELHREVIVDGVTSMELSPLVGYENLVSDVNGIIPKIDNTLPARTYYLIEKSAVSGYLKITDGIRFTVSPTGEVTLTSHPLAELTETFDQETGLLTFAIRVKNLKDKAAIRIVKIDQTGAPLENAGFTFAGGRISADCASRIPQGGDYALIYENGSVALGSYSLTETTAPAGYDLLEAPIDIVITSGTGGIEMAVSMNGVPLDPSRIHRDLETGLWTIEVMNTTGYELPSTGGLGRTCFYLGGLLLMGVALVLKRNDGNE